MPRKTRKTPTAAHPPVAAPTAQPTEPGETTEAAQTTKPDETTEPGQPIAPVLPGTPGRPGMLGLETPLVTTAFMRDGYLTARAVTFGNDICALDGPVGTGKTTCARYVAHYLDRPCAVATMPNKPASLDLLRRVHLAVTGQVLEDSRFRMQNALLPILTDWGGVLIVDELQYSHHDSMQELVWLYEETNHAFALVVVGAGVLAATAEFPQLYTRIMGKVVFQPLTSDDLLEALHALDPRLADTNPTLLFAHDQAACRGLLRKWVHTIKWMDGLGLDGPATREDFIHIAGKLTEMDDAPQTGAIRHRRRKK